MSNFTKRLLTLVLSFALVLSLALPAAAATGTTPSDTDIVVPLPGPGGYLTSTTQAAIQLRNGLKARQESIDIKLMTVRTDVEALVKELYAAAIEHTGVPTEGDYLRYQMGDCEIQVESVADGSYAKLTITYTPDYYTTAQQEAAVDAAIEQIKASLNVEQASDYEKTKAVYDAICAQVKYDTEGLAASNNIVYTAYDALVNGKAVCQGYAVLFYRAMLELGVDTRVVTGEGQGEAHAWNIVELEGKYYNVDATWDATLAQNEQEYQFFLKANATFAEHERDEEFNTDAFNTAYPMAAADYVPFVGVPGDVNGDSNVNVEDVIRLLLHVTMPDEEAFMVTVNANYDGIGGVDVNDVIRLLLHVTMPDEFDLVV